MFWPPFHITLGILSCTCSYVAGNPYTSFGKQGSSLYSEYGLFTESERLEMLDEARKMFHFGYDNYMEHAFPHDELDPIHCTGRGPDYANPSNININDALGDYALTLIDSLDTLAIMGNTTEFKRAVRLVIENVSFEKANTVQVFEATIRVLGSLLSAHLIITDPLQPFGDVVPAGYKGELLQMAHDLATRLMPAFEYTATGIPHPRVNLQTGVPKDCCNKTCTAGAGSLVLEFGVLSHLLADPVYEAVARRAVQKLWKLRSNVTGLLGTALHIQTGEWIGRMSGIGAGLDSFYEYMLKAFILFGNKNDLKKFNESYESIKYYIRRGRAKCNTGSGHHPIYVNVNMRNGEMVNNWIDSLQAAWPGIQVLNGDVEEAICTHMLFFTIWRKYGALPERFNWQLRQPEVPFYPLRPELVESTYLLYQATHNPFYLHVGRHILRSLNNHTKVRCGYATIHDVRKKDLEDRMESFFLSETCKYLFLLFDFGNHVNKEASRYIFTTEGHLFPIRREFRKASWQQADETDDEATTGEASFRQTPDADDGGSGRHDNYTVNCKRISDQRLFMLPIESQYLRQLEAYIGISN